MNRKQLIAQLRELKSDNQVTLDSSWISQTKTNLLSTISAPAVEETSSSFVSRLTDFFVPYQLRLIAQPAVTLALVVFASAVGWTASVSASYQSLPGDLLYHVKIANEKTQIAFAGAIQGSEQKAHLLSNAAKTRAYEAKELIAQQRTDLVAETLTTLTQTVQQAKESVNLVASEDPAKAVGAVAQLQDAGDQISKTLGEAIDTDGADAVDLYVVAQVVQTTKEVKTQSIEAVQSIVAKQESGTLQVDSKAVEAVVKDAVNKLGSGVQETTLSVGKAVEKSTGVAAASSTAIISVTTSTLPLLAPTTTPKATAAASTTVSIPVIGGATSVSVNVAKATTLVQQSIETAKTLVDAGKFSQALETVKNAVAVGGTIASQVVENGQKQATVLTAPTSLPTTTQKTTSTASVGTTTKK